MVSKKKVLLISLVFSMVFIFAFIQVTKEEVDYSPRYYLIIELNETTKDNLTAVFYFNYGFQAKLLVLAG